jgi:hypothetical protein
VLAGIFSAQYRQVHFGIAVRHQGKLVVFADVRRFVIRFGRLAERKSFEIDSENILIELNSLLNTSTFRSDFH